MGELLRVLIIDDSEADVLLLQRALRKRGLKIDSTRVDTAETMREAMADLRWDVAISDCHMPRFTPEDALVIWKEDGHDQPLIVVSGAVGEEEAVALLKAGAQDFVRKDNLARLVPAIERELREAESRRCRREAEGASRSKSAFLAHMFHELRSPLASILGYSQLLQRSSELSESVRKKVDIINNSGNHLCKLIDDVLEISRIEAGRMELNNSNFGTHKLFDDIESMFRLRVEEKGLQLRFELTVAVPEQLSCDEGKLRQVLINLLSNAVKFTDSGVISIFVDLEQSKLADHLIISVKDSGIGIAPNDLRRLFQSYEQTRTGKSHGGTGLGLMISRKYARLMGGDLVASSMPQQGSTFTFSCQVELNKELQVPVDSGQIIIGLDLGEAQKTLLLVDDIAETRTFLAEVLKTPGLRIVEAQNGAEALELVDKEKPDLVIMDMRMDVMDGFEAIRRLKLEQRSTIPVIAASASAFEIDREEIMATGADAFFRKPFDEREVLETVARLLKVERVYTTVTGVRGGEDHSTL